MGEIKPVEKEKLVIGFIYKDVSVYESAKEKLIKKFGKIDFENAEIDFTHTNYYESEMGKTLKRKFLSFEKTVYPGKLAEIKIFTNKIEQEFSDNAGRRKVNIDPGLLSLASFKLATTKNFSHRIYIGKGIYAEVTLQYTGKSFTPWQWTYPDYASREYIDILNNIRNKFKEHAE